MAFCDESGKRAWNSYNKVRIGMNWFLLENINEKVYEENKLACYDFFEILRSCKFSLVS